MSEQYIGELKNVLDNMLNEIKDNSESDNINKIIKTLNSADMRIAFDNFLELNAEGKSLELLGTVLKCCSMVYEMTGESTGISDSEYDQLLEYYRSKTGDDIIGSEVDSSEGVFHKYPSLRGTLDKIYKLTDEDVIKNKSQRSINDWVSSAQRQLDEAGVSINLWEETVYGFPKFDGVSCVFECDESGKLKRALTRGDVSTNEARDITHIFKDIFESPIVNPKSEHGLKTEIMMTNSDFEEIKKEEGINYKNSRSIVSSILNSNEVDKRAEKLVIVPLRYSYYENGREGDQMLAPGAFNYPYVTCTLKELDKLHEFAFNHAVVSPGLRCDGMVIYFTNPKVQEILGRRDNKQKFEVAFKFTEEVAYSKVVDVEFTTGSFGRMNPRVVFKPVKMKGNKISKASLGSYDRFKDLSLHVGDKVKVYYDIIPYATFDESDPKCKRSDKELIEAPVICPDCGYSLEENETGSILYCTNPKCPCRQKGKILNFLTKMNIREISEETVEDFYDEGFLKSIEDIYHLADNYKKIIKLHGYGKNKVTKILGEIDAHRRVYPSTLLGSIGIEGMGIKKFKPICEKYSISQIIDHAMCDEIKEFLAVKGIQEKSALKIVEGVKENVDLIYFLMDELEVLDEPTEKDILFTVAFTKVRDKNLENLIRDYGGEVTELTKSTSLLVVPQLGITSSKVKNAEKYGIPIVPIEEAQNYIEGNLI